MDNYLSGILKLLTIVVISGGTYILYRFQKKRVLSRIINLDCFDMEFVKNWISNQDFENYNSSYTVVMLRNSEIPKIFKYKLFIDTTKLISLAVYDKKNKNIVSHAFFIANSIAPELANDNFIEFPFE